MTIPWTELKRDLAWHQVWYIPQTDRDDTEIIKDKLEREWTLSGLNIRRPFQLKAAGQIHELCWSPRRSNGLRQDIHSHMSWIGRRRARLFPYFYISKVLLSAVITKDPRTVSRNGLIEAYIFYCFRLTSYPSYQRENTAGELWKTLQAQEGRICRVFEDFFLGTAKSGQKKITLRHETWQDV